jgi:cellulose synthase/poly-beta-1,6-N-acetylglucosamine synthase-like glycosyltransferase
MFPLRKRVNPHDEDDPSLKYTFLRYEMHLINDYYRKHKTNILSFVGIYFLIFLSLTWMIWLPILLIALPTVFAPTFYLFNYTTFLNPFIKVIWLTYFEILKRFYKKRLYDDKRH